MKKGQWSDIYGDTPDSFRMKVEDTLDRLEEKEMKRKYRVSVVLVAAVLFVLLAGTALAMGYSSLMEYLDRSLITPLEETQELIQTDLGEDVQELISFKIEEAVFDGQTAVVQLLLTPTNPEKHALLNMGVQDVPESIYNRELTQHADGTETMRVIGRRDGKEIINYSLGLYQAEGSTGYQFELSALDAQELDDGSVRVWLEGSVIEGSTDKVELIVRSKYDFSSKINEADWTGYNDQYEQQITLSAPDARRAARLIPVGEAKGERFEILSAWMEFNLLRGHLIVEYSYLPDMNNEPMGVAFRLYDAEGNPIAIGSGDKDFIERRMDGTQILRSTDEIQAFEKFPETVYLEVKVVGEERVLGRVECKIMETDEITLLEPSADNQGEFPEERPIGLALKPEEDVQGEHIRLLEGMIRSGREVTVSFIYDGDPKDIGKININYKKVDGTTVGTPITSSDVIKEDCSTRTDILDGSGWPANYMVLEFTMDGVVIDSFTCFLSQVFSSR